MKKVLFVSLSALSSGELRYLFSQLSEIEITRLGAELYLHENFREMADAFKGMKLFHRFSMKTPLADFFRELSGMLEDYGTLVFIDLNACLLENNFSEKDQDLFRGFGKTVCESGRECVFLDYYESLSGDESLVLERRKRAEARIDGLLETVRSKMALSSRHKMYYYFTKFLKKRALSQLCSIPDPMKIIRPVPFAYPKEIENRVLYYKNRFEHIPNRGRVSKTILIGFSGFSALSVGNDILKEIFRYTACELTKRFTPDKLILIDPTDSCRDLEESGSARIEWYHRMERSKFLESVSEIGFACVYIPYSTIGSTCLQNGIPCVSFSSSGYLTGDVLNGNVLRGVAIPPFHSLGIWEDIAFYDEISRNNPYFDAVIKTDLCDSVSFDSLAYSFESGNAYRNAEKYKSDFENLHLPLFTETLEKILDGTK